MAAGANVMHGLILFANIAPSGNHLHCRPGHINVNGQLRFGIDDEH